MKEKKREKTTNDPKKIRACWLGERIIKWVSCDSLSIDRPNDWKQYTCDHNLNSLNEVENKAQPKTNLNQKQISRKLDLFVYFIHFINRFMYFNNTRIYNKSQLKLSD